MNETNKNILEMTPIPEEQSLEVSLRPQSFDEYVGQKKIKEKLSIFSFKNFMISHFDRMFPGSQIRLRPPKDAFCIPY